MRAIGFEQFGESDVLRQMDLPVPEPDAGEVLVHVRAAGVNPVDWKVREGQLKDVFPHKFPVIPGWDAAGVVEKAGPQTKRFKKGDEVFAYCRKPAVNGGTYAEYVCVSEFNLARKPNNLSFEEAAAVPLAALTAFQALFDAAGLQRGEAVLIHAAAGGVGGYAVQLASWRGARVLGTARQKNHDYIRSLGCSEPIDYTKVDFRRVVQSAYPAGIDVVLDTVGGDTYERSLDVLKEGGRIVSIIDPPASEEGRVKKHYVFVSPNPAELEQLTDMIERGQLRSTLTEVLPLEKAAEAQQKSQQGHTRGKIVLRI